MTRGSPGRGRSRPYILLLYKSHKTRTTCRIYTSKNQMKEGEKTILMVSYLIPRSLPSTPNTLYGSMCSYILRPHWKWVCCSAVSVRRMEVPGSTNTIESYSRNIFHLLNTIEILRCIQSCYIDWLFVPMPMYLARFWFSC
jgi:hypothetical protein